MSDDGSHIGPVKPRSLASNLVDKVNDDELKDAHASALCDLETFAQVTADLEENYDSLRSLCIRTTASHALDGMPILQNERLQTMFSETAAFKRIVESVQARLEDGGSIDDEQLLEQFQEAYRELLATPTYRMYFVCLILNALDTEDPLRLHYAYADDAIGEESPPKQVRYELARKLCEACNGLRRLVDLYRQSTFEGFDPDASTPKPQFDAPYFNGMYAGSRETGEMNIEGASPVPEVAPHFDEPILWLDAAAIEWASNGFQFASDETAEQPFAPYKTSSVNDMYDNARERWQQHRDDPELLKWWADPKEDAPTHVPIIKLLCEHLWHDEIKPDWRRQETAGGPLIAIGPNGDEHAQMGSEFAPAAPTFGNGGKIIEVSGDEYGHSVICPHHPCVLVNDCQTVDEWWQTSFALDTDDKAGDPKPILTVPEAKLFVRFALVSRRSGDRQSHFDGRATIRDLARDVFASRQSIGTREYKDIARLVRRFDRDIRFPVPQPNGVALAAPFYVEPPDRVDGIDPDFEVYWQATPRMLRKLHELEGCPGRNNFIFNKTAFMEMGGRRAQNLRAYLKAASMFNRYRSFDEGEVKVQMLPKYSATEWAAETGAMSDAAWNFYQNDETTARDDWGGYDAKNRARDQAWGSLQSLENRGLIVIEGRRSEFKVLPPDELKIAWEQFRDGTNEQLGG